MKQISIKMKITLWYTAIILLLAGLTSVAMIILTEKTVWQKAEQTLQEEMGDLLEEIKIENGTYEIDEDVSFYEEGVIFSLYDQQGQLMAGRVPESFPIDTILKAGKIQQYKTRKQIWLTYDVALSYGTENVLWVRGILSGSSLVGMELLFVEGILLALPLLVLLAGGGGYFITSRAFRPVERIRRAANTIGEGKDLSKRIPEQKGGGELQALAATFNQMLERLESSFEKEKQFTADASHELRTPISVIRSQCEYALLEDTPQTEQKECLEVILQQSDKMARLISQLLFLARADSGKQIEKQEILDLGVLAEMAVEDCRGKASAKKIQIESCVGENLLVNGNELSLLRLFVNLLDNGIRYGRTGGHLILTLERVGERVEGCVKDDGIGIPNEHLEKIWDRFYQVDKSRNREGEGTGLGLSMVKWIIECHGGEIRVDSQLGKGSRFSFWIPMVSEKNSGIG